jgi:hypothetical protein
MKAIQVRYLPATAKLPSRMVATAEGGHKVTHTFDHSGKEVENVMRALCEKLSWTGTWVCGGMPRPKDGVVYVPVDAGGAIQIL